MSIPVTTRLDQDLVTALDTAVGAGLAPSRSSLVAAAVREWLAGHDEAAIVDSYRRCYSSPDPAHEQLIQRLATFAVSECLADES
ncbi:MAG: ribbon-helix-helix domain-containing protein [Acidimicrobiales bacterium]